jgi:hypothetical protein
MLPSNNSKSMGMFVNKFHIWEFAQICRTISRFIKIMLILHEIMVKCVHCTKQYASYLVWTTLPKKKVLYKYVWVSHRRKNTRSILKRESIKSVLMTSLSASLMAMTHARSPSGWSIRHCTEIWPHALVTDSTIFFPQMDLQASISVVCCLHFHE